MAEQDWFEVQRFPHDVTMIREPHHAEDVKVYLIEGRDEVAVLDTGMGVGDFAGLVRSLSTKRPIILQTHAHWDHVGASRHFEDVRVHPSEVEGLRGGFPAARYVAAFSADAVDPERLPVGFDPSAGLPGREPTGLLEDGEHIDLGDRVLEVIHTPGHSSGGVSFLDRAARALFVGDLLYLGKMYIFFPGSSPAGFRRSLQRVGDLMDEVDRVFPAHNAAPITPADVLAIKAAFEEVWAGKAAGRNGSLFGYDLTIFDFDGFSFLLPAADWRAVAGSE